MLRSRVVTTETRDSALEMAFISFIIITMHHCYSSYLHLMDNNIIDCITYTNDCIIIT